MLLRSSPRISAPNYIAVSLIRQGYQVKQELTLKPWPNGLMSKELALVVVFIVAEVVIVAEVALVNELAK